MLRNLGSIFLSATGKICRRRLFKPFAIHHFIRLKRTRKV